MPEVREPEENGAAFGVQRGDQGFEWSERQLRFIWRRGVWM